MEDLLKNEEKKEIPREYVEMAYVKETAAGPLCGAISTGDC